MIRPFLLKDKKAIRKLFYEENHYHHKLAPNFVKKLSLKNVMNMRWLRSVYDSKDREILVDERNGQIVGLIMFTQSTLDDQVFNIKNIVHINELYVDQAYQGQGVGSGLMAYVEQYARETNVDAIRLEVWRENNHARGFYDRLGYDVTKEIRYKLFEK